MSRCKVYALPGFIDRLEEAMSEHNNYWWAKRLNKDRKTCSAYRNGWSVPDCTALGRICTESGYSADWILFGKGNKYEKTCNTKTADSDMVHAR